MLRSKLCSLLGIEYPIFQGGMAWIADGKLAAAVSNGGGLGIVAAGNAPADYVRQQIRIAAAETGKPFGVNIMLMSPFADAVASRPAQVIRPSICPYGRTLGSRSSPSWRPSPWQS